MRVCVVLSLKQGNEFLRMSGGSLRDVCELLRVLSQVVGNRTRVHGAAVVHAGELASTAQEVEEIIPVHAVCRGPGGVGKYHGFAFQFVTGGAV